MFGNFIVGWVSTSVIIALSRKFLEGILIVLWYRHNLLCTMKYYASHPGLNPDICAQHPLAWNRNVLLKHLLQLRKGLEMFSMYLTNHGLEPRGYITNYMPFLILGIIKILGSVSKIYLFSLICSLLFFWRKFFRNQNAAESVDTLQVEVSL